jgi:serine/threonine-protein kinase
MLTAQATMGTAPPDFPSSSSSGQHGRFVPGTKLGNRYRVVALLGRGGMGEVYRADDLELGQAVALKFLPEALSHNSEELTRFRGEVRVARQIAHPNVCRVYDIGQADGHVFLSMEYVDGEDLASVLRRMGRPTADKAIEIARQICLGLAAAHEAGMLHRDLKPANIMIDGRGRVRITDFGLAGLADELAKEGSYAGTPAYMAPEQITGGRVSVRSDIYALGLLLYEVFTGKRVFDTTNFAELKRLHESGTLTTPSELVRDLDPAVERVILRCLERDPESRPPSAYAVLGGLPGGDPLAAALAAGETPSPELVANASDRGSMSPLVAFACLAAGLIGIGVWAGLIAPDFRVATQPTSVLSVRATELLGKTGSLGSLPPHTAEGFDQNPQYLKHLLKDKVEREQKHSAIYFWRRWSPRILESPNLHREIAGITSPPLLSAGQATLLLDPAGRLIGLRAIPPDTLDVRPGGTPDWTILFGAAGLDLQAFTPAPLVRHAPAICDSAAAWTGRLPWAGAEPVTIQAGAWRGRPTYFTIVHDWGASTAPVDSLPSDPARDSDWSDFLLFSLLPLAASLFFGARNLKLGRGDRKGATRIAVFVFVMNLLEGTFATRLSEDGLLAWGFDVVNGRAIGHALLHAVSMWFAYIALEPYVRRLWPRLLVSWTRLISGRLRDPLVGRDLLVGGAAGIVMIALATGVQVAALRTGFARVVSPVNSGMLDSLTSLANTAVGLSYAGSVCVLTTLETLVLVLVLRLLLRRTWAAILVSALLLGTTTALGSAPTDGWLVAGLNAAVIIGGSIFVLMRFGLLPGVTAAYVALVMASAVASVDFSSWYADRALLSMGLLVGLLIYGTATALAGKSILGDPLKDAPGR